MRHFLIIGSVIIKWINQVAKVMILFVILTLFLNILLHPSITPVNLIENAADLFHFWLGFCRQIDRFFYRVSY